MIWKYLKTLFGRQSVNTTKPIESHEVCRRFLFDGKLVKRNQVKHQAFAPSKKTGNVSIFLKDRFLSEEDYQLTRKTVSNKRGRQCKAEGEFIANAVDKVRNEVGYFLREGQFVLELDETDFPHHANLDKWPSDKPSQKQLQQALAAKVSLINL